MWGARTLSSDPEWRYINVRRLFNYIAESIMAGHAVGVFEPNDERLWMQLKIERLELPHARRGASGALFGPTPNRRSSSSATRRPTRPSVIEAGQVVCEIGIAPVKPAEFVVFRISQYSADASEVSE